MVNDCVKEPCMNNGTCIDLVNDISCNCSRGFEGRFCEINTNDCVGIDCNNGICEDLIANYMCVCNMGYTGQFCDEVINLCVTSNPCLNNGSCITITSSNLSSVMCSCAGPYNGDHCEIFDPCVLSPCQNKGVCVFNESISLGYSCECPRSYTGLNCEVSIPTCELLLPCQNGGTCINSDIGYLCRCSLPFAGENCTEGMYVCSFCYPLLLPPT